MANVLGVMLDCSRNSVMRPDKVKEFAKHISAMGYNMLQLYTEDTYEIDGEGFFGCTRGKYTADEIKDIDEYCKSIGIELTPCIQVLAHLNGLKRWDCYKEIFDCNDILLVDDDRTYQLIEKMVKTSAENFSSRQINIGMDEAHMVGLGKYLDEHGYENRFEILERHLTKVLNICAKYGFKPMMWSDMFFKLAGKTDYWVGEFEFDEFVKSKVPKGVSLVYWDYYHVEKDGYTAMLKNHAQLSDDVWYAGSVWTSAGFSPKNYYALDTALPALEACREQGVKNVLMTAWGNNGSECSYFSVLPSLMVIAEVYRNGSYDLETVKRKFFEITGESYDDLTALDQPARYEKHLKAVRTVDKYALYNDPLYGVFDSAVPIGISEYYRDLADKLKVARNRTNKYKYVFEYASSLCSALELKSELSRKTKELYDKADKTGILNLVKNVYPTLIQRLKDFKRAFREYWYTDYKAFGFEVQDVRLGGLISRLETCEVRLTDYATGKVERLEELETDRKTIDNQYEKGKTILFNNWAETVTANIIN